MQDRVRAEFNAVSLSRRCITRKADEINLDIEAQQFLWPSPIGPPKILALVKKHVPITALVQK